MLRPAFLQDFLQLLGQPKSSPYPLQTFWRIGHLLRREEEWNQWDNRQRKAAMKNLSEQLGATRDKPLNTTLLSRLRKFHQVFPDEQELRPELTWSHYLQLLRIEEASKRTYYLHAAADFHWTAEQLSRQIKTDTFGRRLSQTGSPNNGNTSSSSILKSNYVFEFLPPPPDGKHTEKALLDELMKKLPSFLLELGEGFSFVACQKRLCTPSGRQFFIDMVFYHTRIKCHVLIDFKTASLTHGDIGQMDMYLRLHNDLCQLPGDQPAIGLLLCAHIDPTITQYSILQSNNRLHAANYSWLNGECKMENEE